MLRELEHEPALGPSEGTQKLVKLLLRAGSVDVHIDHTLAAVVKAAVKLPGEIVLPPRPYERPVCFNVEAWQLFQPLNRLLKTHRHRDRLLGRFKLESFIIHARQRHGTRADGARRACVD